VTKTIARCVFACAVSVWLILSLATPWVLADSNTFLKNFVNHEMLAFLGVVVTITLASATNLHFVLNGLEEREQRRGFWKARAAIRRSATSLIVMLLMAIALTVAKPLVVAATPTSGVSASLFNGAALLIVLFNVLVLIDLTQAAFQVGPNIENSRDGR